MFKKGLLWILVGYVFNILETWYFGWNMKPQSVAEKFCDNVAVGIILVGFCIIAGWAAGATVWNYVIRTNFTIVARDGEDDE